MASTRTRVEAEGCDLEGILMPSALLLESLPVKDHPEPAEYLLIFL